jgi:hypothetical protein
MRTTLSIDDQTDTLLRRIAQEQNLTYKDVINRALKEGVRVMEVHEAPPKFEVRAKNYGFQPGVDFEKMNQLLDEMEAGD